VLLLRRLSLLFIGYYRMDLRVELDVIDTGHRRRLYSSPVTPPQRVFFGVPLHRGFGDRMRHPPARVTHWTGAVCQLGEGRGPCVVTETWPRDQNALSAPAMAQYNTVLYNNNNNIIDATTVSGEHNCMRVIVSWSESNPIHLPTTRPTEVCTWRK